MLTPRKIKLGGEGGTIRIDWSDAHVSAYPYQYLRDRCPCAMCNDKRPYAHGEPAPPSPFQMFQKVLKPDRAELVGRYAVQMHWSDGHSSGIYDFDYLRSLCPCSDCEAARKADARADVDEAELP